VGRCIGVFIRRRFADRDDNPPGDVP